MSPGHCLLWSRLGVGEELGVPRKGPVQLGFSEAEVCGPGNQFFLSFTGVSLVPLHPVIAGSDKTDITTEFHSKAAIECMQGSV